MAYNGKTDWALNDTVQPVDMNRIEGGIEDVDTNKLDKTANATSATKLQTPRTIGLNGAATGTPTSFDGSGNIIIPVTAINPNNLSAATPISKGGTGATSAAAARTALDVPETNQVNAINKYNVPTFTRTASAPQTITVTPIPTTGWVEVVAGTEYTNGGYRVRANGTNGTNNVTLAVDGNTSTRWQSTSQTAPFFQVELPTALTVQKVKVQMPLTQGVTSFKIQGSNNGTAWTDLYSGGVGQFTGQMIELTLTSTGLYKFYRAAFTASSVTMFSLYEFQLSQYVIEGYTTTFSITGVPTTWANNQRILVSIPSNYNVLGVTTNTLNNIAIDRILEPNKYYELRYSGNMFYSKEI